MTPMPNAVIFPIKLDLLAGGVIATDAGVRAAMRFAHQHCESVIEPGGAVGIAAVFNGLVEIRKRAFATVVTGGKIDPARFCTLTKEDIRT